MSATPSEATRAFRRLRRHDLPELLRQIHDPPRALFLRGLAPPEVLAKPAVAVVGARACSPYGAQVARMLGRELAAAGLVVVSGLARGVDGEAHRGALEATGLTVAVLGCGIDRDYPAAHAELARRICERGLVVSEYEPGVEPAPWRFPARNRIIAGLAAVTVIVEARERSGALITADFALEGGREVFAVPGEITGSLANGTNRLLRQGATPLTSTEDVLELFGLAASQRPRAPTVGATAAAVLEHLADGAASADELARATGLEPGPVAAALMELELAGLTVEADGRYRGWCGQTTSIVDIESSYWLEDERPTFPTRRHSGRVDVAIVGAGVTGCSCALALAQAGLRVRVHEAREVAGGASGRNGGFALRGSAAPYDVARAKLGPERAASLWRLTERALGQLADLAGDAFRRTGSLRLATNAAEADVLAAECAALREDGFAAELQTALDPPLAGRFDAALVHPPDGAISPARWARRLAALAAEAGAEIREQTPVRDLGELEAEQIVLATDGYTEGLLAELDAAVHPTRGQVIATAPLATARYPRPHYTYDGIRYWHQTDEGRLILGGFRDLALAEESTREEATTPTIQVALESFASDLLGEKPKITHRWAGIFGATADQLPLVGRVPSDDRVWVSCGYSGHGNVLGLACGELVAEAILGRPAPELELFDPARVLRASSPTS